MSQWGSWFAAVGLAGGFLAQCGCATPSSGVFTDQNTVTPLGVAAAKLEQVSPALAIKASMAVGMNLEKNGDDEAAIEQFNKVLERDPNHLAALQHLAALHDHRCEFNEADAVYQKLAKTHPRDADVFSDWGYSYYLRNNWPEAEKLLRRALELNSHHERAHCNLGLALGQQGRYPEALREFQAAPMNEAEAHCNLAFVYWSQNKLDDALRECRLARQMDPHCVKAKDLLARLEAPRYGMQARANAAAGLPVARVARTKAPASATAPGFTDARMSGYAPGPQSPATSDKSSDAGYKPFSYSASEGTPAITTLE
jgi:Tfp pilus assembly protein PilF